MWGLQPFPSPMYFFGMWSPFGSVVSFVTLDREQRFTLVVVPFRYSQPFLGSSRRIHMSSFGLSGLLVAGGRAISWIVTELCQWTVFSWPHLLLSYEPSVCCLAVPEVVRPLFVGLRVSWPSCLYFALQLALVMQVPVGSLLPYGSQPSR